MGTTIAKPFKTLSSMFNDREAKILMLGLDDAGKTSILYSLKLDQHVSTTPTLGFNCECIELNNLKLNVWDVGGLLSVFLAYRIL